MTFDPVELERTKVLERMQSRLLLQFQNAPVLRDVLCALGSEVEVLLDTTRDVIIERSPLEAIKAQLDALGRIVGQSRIPIDNSKIRWMMADLPGVTPDRAPVWIEGAPVSGQLFADDNIYRRLIETRVYRNFSEFASIPENQHVAILAFDLLISFRRVGPMIVNIHIPLDTSDIVAAIVSDSLYAQNGLVSIMPYPPTLWISGLYYLPQCPFAPDDPCGPDVGLMSVRRPFPAPIT